MAVKLTIKNPDIFKKLLQKKLESGLMPALEKAKEVVEAKFDQNPAGWKPLTSFTIRERRSKGFGPTPILYRTGRLKGQAVQEVALDNPNEGHISTSDPIAVKQNNGEGRIPARPFYSLSDEDKKVIFEAFKAGIKW